MGQCAAPLQRVPFITKSSCCQFCSLMIGNYVTSMSSNLQVTAWGEHMGSHEGRTHLAFAGIQ